MSIVRIKICMWDTVGLFGITTSVNTYIDVYCSLKSYRVSV